MYLESVNMIHQFYFNDNSIPIPLTLFWPYESKCDTYMERADFLSVFLTSVDRTEY